MTDAYRVRRARDDDVTALVPLWQRLVEFEASLSKRFTVKDDAAEQWLAELNADREARRADVFLVETAEGEPVAFLHVRATRGAPFHSVDRIGFIDAVWVEPPHRKHGLAKRLISAADQWCRARRLDVLEAGVVTANKDAMAAWHHLGFATTAATVTRPLGVDPRKAVARAFDQQAPRIDSSRFFTFEKRVRRLVEFARPDPTHRLLEVGCGPGVLLSAFRDRAGPRVGVELSPEMARLARERSGAEIVLAAAEHLPFKEGSFQRVVSRAVVHHLEDAASGVAEMARVLVPDGALVVEDVVASEHPEKARRHNELEALRDPSHARALAPSEVAEVASRAGLEPEEALNVREIRSLDEWLAITEPPAANAALLRELAQKYGERAEFDETGLMMRVVGDEVRFDQTHLLLRARKKA